MLDSCSCPTTRTASVCGKRVRACLVLGLAESREGIEKDEEGERRARLKDYRNGMEEVLYTAVVRIKKSYAHPRFF